jgi:hypothetical protein
MVLRAGSKNSPTFGANNRAICEENRGQLKSKTRSVRQIRKIERQFGKCVPNFEVNSVQTSRRR